MSIVKNEKYDDFELKVEFENLFILKELLQWKKVKCIAILGEAGAGKSMIGNLLIFSN